MRAKRRKMPETIYSFLCEIRLLPWKDLSHWFAQFRDEETGWRLVSAEASPPPTQSARQAVGPASTGWSLAITCLDWTTPWLLTEILWFFSSGLRLMASHSTFLCLYLSISKSQPVALPPVTLSSQDQKASDPHIAAHFPKDRTALSCPFFLYSKEIWSYLPQSSPALFVNQQRVSFQLQCQIAGSSQDFHSWGSGFRK